MQFPQRCIKNFSDKRVEMKNNERERESNEMTTPIEFSATTRKK